MLRVLLCSSNAPAFEGFARRPGASKPDTIARGEAGVAYASPIAKARSR
jgi:hypothetical protein